jgi:asparagine synthase (glutamine-hydrolysing)
MGAAWADIHTYLPDDLLVKVDIASMANSLEARSPFLDHELMSWAATIPENQRFTRSEPKALLKKAMEPFLPRDLLYRPKMGFGVPVELWLRGELKEIVRETLLGRTATERGLFRHDAIEEMLTRHWSGENFAPQLWALLMLELWFQMWIDPAEPFAGSVPERLSGHTAAVAA